MPDAAKKDGTKMVPVADLIALKKKYEKGEAEWAKDKSRISELERQVKITKANLDDDPEVKAVRQALLDQADELAKREESVQSKVASFEEREKESLLQTLVTKYGVSLDDIKGAENPKEKALEMYTERLESEKGQTSEKKDETSAAEQTFESGTSGGKVKKTPLEMNAEEFKNYESSLKQGYYSTKK